MHSIETSEVRLTLHQDLFKIEELEALRKKLEPLGVEIAASKQKMLSALAAQKGPWLTVE
jgi:hypothetical protein